MRDEVFIRGKVPMTKSEVRAVSLSKLELRKDSVLYDVGAGTGSVSIEAALILTHGTVYAIEEKPLAAELIRANKEKFQADHMEIVTGTAPEALKTLKSPTHAFIGGTGGCLYQILDRIMEKNPKVRVVVNIIALETLNEMINWLKDREILAEIVQVQVSKAQTAGKYHLMTGQNPVFVISFGGENTGLEEENAAGLIL